MPANMKLNEMRGYADMGYVDRAGIVIGELHGELACELWIHLEKSHEDERVWLCTDRERLPTRKFKSIKGAINAMTEIGLYSFEVFNTDGKNLKI